MVTEFSLQTLVDIAEHQTISRCIKHLIIGLDNFKAVKPQTLPTLEEYQRFQSALYSQERLLDTGVAIDLLAKALAKLPNLETVDIRDFNSATRYRDKQTDRVRVPEWRSYGASEYRAWVGHLGTSLIDAYSPATSDFVDRTFKIVLVALGRSAPRLQALEILLRNSRIGLRDGAFVLSPALDNNLDAVLRGLKKLHLDLHLQPVAISPSVWSFPAPLVLTAPESLYDPTTTNLRFFLSFVPNVTWLRLNFVHLHGSQPAATLLLAWLAANRSDPAPQVPGMSWSKANPEPVDLPLRRLELGNLSITADILAAVIKKFRLLEWLSLKGITLQDDPSHDEADDTFHGSPWPRFFRKLPARAPNLKNLSLRNLRVNQGAVSNMSDDIIFVDREMEFATPSRFVKELRDLDKDRTELAHLAETTWSVRDYIYERHSLASEHNNDQEPHDGFQGVDEEDIEDDLLFESEDADEDDDMAEDLDGE